MVQTESQDKINPVLKLVSLVLSTLIFFVGMLLLFITIRNERLNLDATWNAVLIQALWTVSCILILYLLYKGTLTVLIGLNHSFEEAPEEDDEDEWCSAVHPIYNTVCMLGDGHYPEASHFDELEREWRNGLELVNGKD